MIRVDVLLLAILAEIVAAAPMEAVTTPRDAYPDFSPAGDSLVYQSNATGRWHIWQIDLETGERRRLTDGDHDNFTPVYSPEGERIVFASERSGNRDIYVMSAHGDDVRNITSHPALDMHPEWTTDGRIVFNSSRAHEDTADAFIMNADGTDVRALTDDPSWDTYAALAPNGKQLVWRHVVAAEENNSDVFVRDIDSGVDTRLTDSPAFDGWPAWSPDGRVIALASNRESERWQDDTGFGIYLARPDGKAVERLTPRDGYSYTQPAWSRDGRRIAAFRWVADDVAEIGHLVILEVPREIVQRVAEAP